MTRTYLVEHVRDFAYDGGSEVVDVCVRLPPRQDRPPLDRNAIQSVRAGYRLDPDT